MARLYELEEAVKNCIALGDDQMVDTESGEILDLEAFEALKLERNAKREQVALYIKNKAIWAEVLKAEAKKLTARAKACEAEAERCHIYLAELLNGEKFETERVKVSWRMSEKVQVLPGVKLPERYLRYKEPEPDKTALKADLKAGVEIEGVSLVKTNNMVVK